MECHEDGNCKMIPLERRQLIYSQKKGKVMINVIQNA